MALHFTKRVTAGSILTEVVSSFSSEDEEGREREGTRKQMDADSTLAVPFLQRREKDKREVRTTIAS